jgi:hypothetical protein
MRADLAAQVGEQAFGLREEKVQVLHRWSNHPPIVISWPADDIHLAITDVCWPLAATELPDS